MMRLLNTPSRLSLLLIPMLLLPFYAKSQVVLDELKDEKSLDHFELGKANSDDYAATPYGKGHVLFLSDRGGNGLAAKDPKTNKIFARPYLLRLKDLKTLTYTAPEALLSLPYYIGQCALIPDSSGLIVSHSRSKADKNGNVGMTLSFIPFNGEEAKELPFIEEIANYQHPYFDPIDYTLYFASNVDGGIGGYDIYKSAMSFNGGWGSPMAVTEVNSALDELFPSTGQNLNVYFSRSTRNYGLQNFAWQAKDSTIMEFPNNGRGDDFAVIVLNDSTLMMSQSKRPGTASNLHLFTVIPPEPAVATEEANTETTSKAEETPKTEEESKTIAVTSGSTPAQEPPKVSSGNYSIIIGGFNTVDHAQTFLDGIGAWAPKAFISPYNDKFYVVHSVHGSKTAAKKARAIVKRNGHSAWVLSKGLNGI